ncbi:reverse transcriptase domain-containing protein [Trichonephila clavipes]|nr:reverse transcriptase domain-containing protein [Trichonephila clavipes]
MKLYKLFIGGKALPWIYDFLRKRLIRVKFNNYLSGSFSFFQGVPQGSVLSPTLFLIYLSSIESVIKRKCDVGEFADDVVLWKPDSDLTKLEKDIILVLEDIQNIALDHKLTFNPTKSMEYGVPVYCSDSVTNLQKLEKDQLSVTPIITGLKHTCPRDIVLFEADLEPLSLRRRAFLTKYYNKIRSLDSQNRTSAYFKDLCNNQRL